MKLKSKLIFTTLLFSSSLLFASSAANKFTPVNNYFNTNSTGLDSFYNNPANLVEDTEGHFSIQTSAYSDVNSIRFLANPASYYSKALDQIKRKVTLSSFDAYNFWKGNTVLINELKENDANFPDINVSNPSDYELGQIKLYFENINTSQYPVSNASAITKAFAMNSNVVSKNNFLLNLNLSYGSVKGGVGYKVLFDSSFLTSGILNTDEGLLSMSLTVPVGYAFNCFEHYDFGFNVRPSVNFMTLIQREQFYSARNISSPIPMLVSDYQFGYGFGVDFGMNYHFSKDLKFSAVVRNLPSVQKYWSMPATAVKSMDFSQLQANDKYNNQPLDIALGLNYIIEKEGQKDYEVTAELHGFIEGLINKDWSNFENMFTISTKFFLQNNNTVQVGYKNKNLFVNYNIVKAKGDTSFQLFTRILGFENGPSFGLSSKFSF